MTTEERFWGKVDKNGPIVYPELGPCWLWTAGCDRYGHREEHRRAGRTA